jgi:hypothetical protein
MNQAKSNLLKAMAETFAERTLDVPHDRLAMWHDRLSRAITNVEKRLTDPIEKEMCGLLRDSIDAEYGVRSSPIAKMLKTTGGQS